jgi:asparagine synthase (glutamine-hydrolysing)
LVAKKFNTNHTTFSLTQDDVFNELDSILDYLDEPFADSSAMPVYVLSKLTRQKVKVALSGDGADEIFGGYIKHWAEYKMRNMGLKETLIKPLSPLWKLLPQSRNNKLGNVIRQLNRFSEGAGLTADERYWRWCSISSSKEASELFSNSFQSNTSEILAIQKKLTSYIDGNKDMNDVLANDMKLVLSGDMLTKVDLMSMANSLEVRTPFLDYTVVEWAFKQPSLYKVDSQFRKKILQTTFKNILPSQLFNRPKKGFEVPLRNWLINGLRNKIESTYLSREFVNDQKIFNYESLRLLWNKLYSDNPGDSAARIWAIVVFQHWYLKYIYGR